MAINRLQGLRGLQGLGSLSKAQYDSFINKNRELISQHGFDPVYINNLYSNKQFIDKYGVEKFKAIPDIDMRNTLYKDDIVNTEFNKWASPFNADGTRDNKKGLGADFEKYSQLSTDGKLKLLESGYLNPSEFESNWQKRMKESAVERTGTGSTPNQTMAMGAGVSLMRSIASLTNAISKGNGLSEAMGLFTPGGEEAAKKVSLDKNQRILDNIYNDDADAAAKRFSTEVGQTYLNDPYIAGLNDNQVKQAFVQAITPGSYRDKNGIPNVGISEFASHYGNGSENQISSEMKDFSIDDMRQILAKKKVYDANMSPDMAATALNNEAKRYITDHQGSLKRFGLFAKDVGISALSYSADKLNGIAELYRAGQDAFMQKPTVMVDDKGNVLDPNKTKVIRDKQGGLHYQGNDGQMHSVHQEQVDYTTLHNMGKNPDGSDIEGAFGVDWMTLNPQYWSRAEQFGTLDENEQKQYEKLGSSPYKIAYNPNEDSDLLYESFKMMSFGLADAASQMIPYGVGLLGKSLSTASKVGKVARGFGKVLDTTGKMLTAETKAGQVAQGTAGALGIAYAYNRGAFQETLQQNLANAEEAAMSVSRNDIYNQYNSDKQYKAGVDKLINARAASLKADYFAQMQKDGGMRIADEKAIDKMLHARAQDAVLGELVQNRVKERMSSKEYADLQQKAIDGAGDAAFNAFLTEGIKYGFVNNLGYRKFLYTNPAGLSKKVSTSLKGLKEITTSEGRKRLATDASKFLTRADKWKEFGKTLGSQAWGGAWTNGTDDMQVDAAERINEDSFNRYLQAYQNGEALASTYSFADGIYSYLKGLQNSLGQTTTWNSATVGGLGSIVNFTPNFANIVRLATKEGREAYKNNFRREVERDENGTPLRNEDDSPKYKDLGKWNDWRGQINYFIQNGVLNNYYAKKQAEKDLQSHADYVNNLLDEYNDFKDIEGLVASNLASENVESIGDQKTLQFIKALHAINTLNKLGEDSKDPTTLSSVVQNAKDLIDKASQLNLEGNNPFSDEEVNNLLSQYYASNPSLEQNEYNSQKALYDIAQNAQKLKEASDAFDNAEAEIQKIEKNRGKSIDSEVRTKMKIQQALNGHWTERKQQMQSEIGDTSSDTYTVDDRTIIASIGGMQNAQSLIKIYDKQKAEIEKELEVQKKISEDLEDDYNKAIDEGNKAWEETNSDALFQAAIKEDTAENKLKSSREQKRYLEDLLSRTNDKKNALETSISSLNEDTNKDTKDKILTADEIFSLDPVTRARMMKTENRDLYSKEQQREIEKLEQRLLMKDADALQKVQDIALLTQRIDANNDAYTRMAKNPEAAAVALEVQRAQAADTAYKLINQRNAETTADFINQFDEAMKGHADVSEDAKNQYVFKVLRKLNPELLDIISEDSLLPKYQKQVTDAKEWGKVVNDIAAVISQADRDDAWKDNALKNIDSVVESSNTKEEIMKSLEKVVDDTNDTEASNDFEYILDGLEKQGYQRDATTLENRKQRKQREAEDNKKKEEAKKKVEEESKKAAEKKAEIDSSHNPNEATFVGEEEDVHLFDETSTEETKSQSVDEDGLQQIPDGVMNAKKLLDDDFKGEAIDMGEMYYGTADNPKKGNFIASREGDKISFAINGNKESLSIEPNEYDVVTDEQETKKDDAFIANSLEKKDGDWYFIGNFAGDKQSSEVKVNNKFDIDKAIERQQEARKLELAAKGVDVGSKNIIDNGDTIQSKSETIAEQAEDITSDSKEVVVSDVNEDAATQNGIGEKNIETNVYTLSGNAMSRYEPKPLEDEGKLVLKKGKDARKDMDNYYAWMDAAGIKLQNIIDHELARIIQRNPHAKVKFMAVTPAINATHDGHMKNHLMMVLDYDNSINKGITAIHDDKNGGVIESNGKKYLVIGTAGYGNMNQGKLALYNILFGKTKNQGIGLMVSGRVKYFKEHPNERFYVNDELTTEVVPYSQIPGYIVRQAVGDGNTEHRSVRELLADKDRNPLGYTMNDVAWGIQEITQFMLVGTTLDKVMVPRNPNRNSGSAFVLMPASNGKLVPSYLKPLRYNEMNDGTLKDRIDSLLQELVAPTYERRLKAVMALGKIFYLDKNDNNILVGKDGGMHKNEVSLAHGDEILKTFVLNSDFDRGEFMKAFSELNPRINITAQVLRSQDALEEYNEAGALQTDAAMFGTAGSSYSVYGLDSNGKMIMPEQPANNTPKVDNSDFRNDKRQQIPFMGNDYYIWSDGTFYLDGKPVTDEAKVKQLQYNKDILDNQIDASGRQGVWDFYIMATGDNPIVIKRNNNTQEVKELSQDQAKGFIKKIEEREAKKAREKEAMDAVKLPEGTKEQTLPEAMADMIEAEDVPLDNGLTVDEETGEVMSDNQSVEESQNVNEEAPAPTSSEDVVSNTKASGDTISFSTLMNDNTYRGRMRKLLRTKWKKSFPDVSQMEKFLRDKDIDVDAIGTSKEDIDAWIKTIEDCR